MLVHCLILKGKNSTLLLSAKVVHVQYGFLRLIFNILIFRSLQVKKNKNNEEGLGERERSRKMGTGG